MPRFETSASWTNVFLNEPFHFSVKMFVYFRHPPPLCNNRVSCAFASMRLQRLLRWLRLLYIATIY